MATTEVNVNTGANEPDMNAAWQVRVVYDNSQTPGVYGPVNWGTANAMMAAFAGRTNVRSATVESIS